MLKETLKEFNNLINNQTFLVYGPEKCEPVTPCIDVYKSIVQPDRSHNNHNVLFQDPEKGEPVTPSMDCVERKIQSDGILDKLKLTSVARRYLKNKDLIGYTGSLTASMSTLK